MTLGVIDILSLSQGGFTAILPEGYTSVTFPLDLPTPAPARVTFFANVAAAVTRSPFTFNQQVQLHQGDYWQASVTLPGLEQSDAENWIAFLLLLNGPVGTFAMGDPLGTTPRGSIDGTPIVHGSSQTGYTLTTRGWNPSSFAVLRVGDYVQVGQRLHKVLRDVDSDSDGIAVLDIWPRLRESPSDGTYLVTSNTKGLFRLSVPNFPVWDVGPNRIYNITFTAVEAI